jgi:hypothetical protein
MAAGQVFKFTDWRFFWFNPLISEPEDDNHQKENVVEQNFQRQVEAIKSQLMP